MARVDEKYHKLCETILEDGYEYVDESRGIICKQISSYTLELDNIYTNFPLLTTKKMFTKGIVGELIWFLRGLDNLEYLHENNIRIWDKDAANFDTIAGMDVGRNYGVQWRDWTHYKVYHGKSKLSSPELSNIVIFEDSAHRKPVDQIGNLIQNLIKKPMGRRHIVTAWNPAELQETALPPCHWAFEIIPYPIPENVKHLLPGHKYFFDLKWHQRSVDTFLGLPFNITSYALLMRIIGELTNMLPNKLIGDLSNVHFYEPHIELVKRQLARNQFAHEEVKFHFSDNAKHYFEAFRNSTLSDNGSNLDFVVNKLEIKDFEFIDYNSYPIIKADMYEPKK